MAGTRKARVPMAEQIRLINECRQSGMTDADWCRENDIAVSTFYNWVSRCRKAAADQIPAANYGHLKEEQICPVCGTQMVLINNENVRRKLKFILIAYKVIEYYSQSYGCHSAGKYSVIEKPVIIKSQVPNTLIGKAPASASTVAWTMYQKYANGFPLY